jgi:ribonuclease Y
MAIVIGIIIGLVVGAALAIVALAATGGSRLAAAGRQRQLLLEEARRDADALRREAQLEAKEESVRLREEIEREVKARQSESVRTQERLAAREGDLERRMTELDRREQGIADREVHARQLQEELKSAKDQELAELERIAAMTVNEAGAEVLRKRSPRRGAGPATSSPTRSSGLPRATPPRPPCRSSSSRPTT